MYHTSATHIDTHVVTVMQKQEVTMIGEKEVTVHVIIISIRENILRKI